VASFCSRVGFELEVLTPSQADALAKLLIEKGLFTREESMRKVSEERATYQNSSIPRSNDHRRHFDLGNHQRLLLIPVVHTVDPEGAPSFTERDRPFLFGHPCEKDSLHGSGLDSRRYGSACSSLDLKLVTIS
jgi:hypothetical protein